MKSGDRNFLIATVAALAVFGGLSMGNALIGKGASGGAIFTTDATGKAVNQNLYATKGDVFLNGGPQNAKCAAAGLPNGDYFFQVTDPSGKTLLSSDDIQQRKFSVANGVIDEYLGTSHVVHPGPCGSRSIGLAPFNTTPNKGGEYKVWVTPVESYAPNQGNFGFRNSESKTDNFKVVSPEAGTGSSILGRVYRDLNANGADDGELGLSYATLTLKPAGGSTVIATVTADAGGYYALTGLAAGSYDLCETVLAGWTPTEPAGGGCARITLGANATVIQNFGNYAGELE